MSPAMIAAGIVEAGFPRVSGDEPVNGVASAAPSKFSPRERG